MIGLFGSMYYMGYLIGSIIFVNVADVYGRQISTRIGMITHCVAFTLMVFISDVYVRYALLFICGLIGSIRCSVSYLAGCEFLLKPHQIYFSSLTQMLNAFSPMIMALYFWKISKHHEYFYYVALGVALLGSINCFYIPESPRWLVNKNKDAKKVLNQIAEINNKPRFDKDVVIVETLSAKTDNKKEKKDDKKKEAKQDAALDSPLRYIMKNPVDRLNVICCALFWTLACIMNYIMNFYIKYVKTEQIFLLMLLSAVAEIFSKTLNGALLKALGFRTGTVFCIGLSLISSLLFLVYTEGNMVIIIIFSCKIFASATYGSMYFACPTLFKSNISATAYNLCNISGKVGAVLGPLFAELNGSIPMVIFALCSLLSLIIVLMFQIPDSEEQKAQKPASEKSKVKKD